MIQQNYFSGVFIEGHIQKFKSLQMLAEPIVKILIHVKDHANALHFDALFFTIILVAFSKAESQCCTVLRSVTYES